MNSRKLSSRKLHLLRGAILFLNTPTLLNAQPSPMANRAFDSYCRSVETRLVRQHQSSADFLAPLEGDKLADEGRLRAGDLVIEQLSPASGQQVSGALLHHWRGTAFAAGAKLSDFEQLLGDFRSYPQHFAPEVLQANGSAQTKSHSQMWMRIRQTHVLTVVMDANYDITFGRLDGAHGYSISHSTAIHEISGAGTRSEHALSADQEHGFLWRLNTYWTFEERDGGLYLQVETVSLTRSVPRGFGWAVRPYLESVPRESIEFTLRSARAAISR